MKTLLLLVILFIGCKSNNNPVNKKVLSTSEIKEQYLKEALRTEQYKQEWMSVQKIIINMNNVSEHEHDTDYVINEYNDLIGKTFGFVDTFGELKNRMKNSGNEYLKSIQLNIAAELLLHDMADSNAESASK